MASSHGLVRDELTWMYPKIEPYHTEFLRVSPLHELYVEQSGNPHGKPVIFLHGGPAGGTAPEQRRFFDPRRYRIVLFDQRGAGHSRPHASIEANTTWDLVDDIERIRVHLGIERWQVFGGSWGSTLALAYAEKHPSRVSELIVRGIFLGRQEELDWLYSPKGVAQLFPEAWQRYAQHVAGRDSASVLAAYHELVQSEDRQTSMSAAVEASLWEARISRLLLNPTFVAKMAEDHHALAFGRISAHYFVNGCFFERENQLLADIAAIRHIPGVIVQARYDVVCPMKSAWELHQAWPEAEFVVVPDAGHSAYEPGVAKALVAATDRFAAHA